MQGQVDVEAELIRTGNWTELKRYYSSRAGHAWELGWVQLLQLKDTAGASEHFQRAFRDPRYEAAAYIVLWKLGKRPTTRALLEPPSLLLYDAYASGRAEALLHFLESAQVHEVYAPALLKACLEKITSQDLGRVRKLPRTASLSLALANEAEKRMRSASWSKIFLEEFYSDPWTCRLLEEGQRFLFEEESERKLRNAYQQKDGVLVKRLLKTLESRLEKAEKISETWKKAMRLGLQWDHDHLTDNFMGLPFWKMSSLSPKALQSMRDILYAPENFEEPPFVKEWKKFFEGDVSVPPPINLDVDSLSLWQIRVEMNHSELSEALLRFPSEERFLFLWSLRQREQNLNSSVKDDPRKWPEDAKESQAVRKNLERAFERTSNKVLWFDRLRQAGCSQDFYEYALSRCALPVEWILDDLQKGVLNITPAVRTFLVAQLSLPHAVLESPQLKSALAYLTPAETQSVLLSRYILAELDPNVLNDDSLDLLWDAKSRVSEDTFERWTRSIASFLNMKKGPFAEFGIRQWRWIEAAWEIDPQYLETFSSGIKTSPHFPLRSYLEHLEKSNLRSLIVKTLPQVGDERLKVEWIERLADSISSIELETIARSLQTEHQRAAILAQLYEREGKLEKALELRYEELENSPILNDQIRVARHVLDLLSRAETLTNEVRFERMDEMGRILERNGALDLETCRRLFSTFVRLGAMSMAWKWVIQVWNRSSLPEKEELLPEFLDAGFRSRSIDEAQRMMLDFIFRNAQPGTLTYEILETLLGSTSVFRLKHLRKEFIERGTQLFPLHKELLKARAAFDFRAVLVWSCFYGDELTERAEVPSFATKRQFSLWRLTESVTHAEMGVFSKYVNALPSYDVDVVGLEHEFQNKAKRAIHRLGKSYRIKTAVDVVVTKAIKTPFRITFQPPMIEVRPDFMDILDDDTWAALSVGVFQILDDRDKGLFEERALMERFFQGMLLSGASLGKLIRLWVWLSISEGLIEPQVLQTSPEKLVQKLPLINNLLIFYFSSDFAEKLEECALIPT